MVLADLENVPVIGTPPASPPRDSLAIVGPLPPLRGGIAQYNSLLLTTLRRASLDVAAFSFRRQYPRWLYPGTTDRADGERAITQDGVAFTIDSMNPLSWIRTARFISERHPRFAVLHWWTSFWAPCFATMIAVLRRHRIPVVLICHNLSDHDAGRVNGWLSRRLLTLADAYLVHSSEHAERLRHRYPKKPVAFHPIPVYADFPEPRQRLSKRGKLELLFFGLIRQYKGLDILLEAFRRIDDGQVHLTIIGEPWPDQRALLELAERLPNVEVHPHFMPAADVADYFDRADYVVLPYRSATGSAVASVALRYNKPLIASNVGGLRDVVVDGVTGKLVPPGDVEALCSALRETNRAEALRCATYQTAHHADWSWESLATVLRNLSPATPRHRRL